MAKKSREINIIIDKLTNSIENSISGDSFKTEVLLFTKDDLKNIKQIDWAFDWETEFKDTNKQLFKLVIAGNPKII